VVTSAHLASVEAQNRERQNLCHAKNHSLWQSKYLDRRSHTAFTRYVPLSHRHSNNWQFHHGFTSVSATAVERLPFRGGAIECDCSEDEPGATPVPLPPGSAVVHAGRTLHYSRGNTTDGPRRAYIHNFRPAAMIARERELGMDHGLTGNVRTVRNSLAD
jgi:ectoine hydroxylase-related dioxygenase (phytanoyl-CoA dioxygenase family)